MFLIRGFIIPLDLIFLLFVDESFYVVIVVWVATATTRQVVMYTAVTMP